MQLCNIINGYKKGKLTIKKLLTLCLILILTSYQKNENNELSVDITEFTVISKNKYHNISTNYDISYFDIINIFKDYYGENYDSVRISSIDTIYTYGEINNISDSNETGFDLFYNEILESSGFTQKSSPLTLYHYLRINMITTMEL